MDEESALKTLTENVRDQDDLERDITRRANLAMIDVEDERDQKRIEKAEANIRRLELQKQSQEESFRKAIGRPALKEKIKQEIARLESEIEISARDIHDFHSRIDQRHQGAADGSDLLQGGSQKLPNESHREFLIRTGKITPFAKFGARFGDDQRDAVEGELANALANAEDEAVAEEWEELEKDAGYGPRSHQNLRAPGFNEEPDAVSAVAETEFSLRPRKKRKVQRSSDSPEASTFFNTTSDTVDNEADFVDDEQSEGYDLTDRPQKKKRKRVKSSKDDEKTDLSHIDDGNENVYQSRLADWVERRSRARLHQQGVAADQPEHGEEGNDDQPEWFKPSPDGPDHDFGNGLKLPSDIYRALFDYQKTGVQWLAELYNQKVGGIIGDEMGLGKTVQLISFVAALHYSRMLDKPVIVVAPATVLQQWVNEFHRWWPPLRVSILHSSGSGMLNVRSESRIEDDERARDKRNDDTPSGKAARRITQRVVDHGHVLVTTYAGLQTYGNILIPIEWGYAVLDEGHKIRNPNTAITIYCKELRTPNRIILSGTPMQNSLIELWSLFDFIFPMRLGHLIDFRNHFENPIRIGGYANASNLQIMTAEKCAQVLKDAISPFLLQRLKMDVATDLPKKSEQVLFCKLTRPQRDAYELFLRSEKMNLILNKNMNSLFGIDILRKICNHPDLLDQKLRVSQSYNWGMANKSGKMQVVKSLLPMWKKMGHKSLLFSQGTQMLDILEKFVQRLGGINYVRMDGTTAIKDRQILVDKFNTDPELDLFLLTTKVGGLGVNLTGASRVIIFDPDWNPSTDVQARERAWRLGQKKEVTIYRLMTAGTIEEKIYHRQIFKQFLSNKVLKDPKQRTKFELSDLHDLFTLGSVDEKTTATGRLFQDSEVTFNGSPALGESASASTSTLTTKSAGGLVSKPSDGDNAQDLRTIDGVASLEDYQPAAEGQPAPTEEARLMEGIFARSGVHSALEHETIIDGKRKIQPSRAILQADANQVAAAASNSLRRAGEEARHIPIGTVTWTGEVGEAGRPSNIRRGRVGPGSSTILARVADRQGRNTTPSRSGASSSASTLRGETPSRAAPASRDSSKIEEFARMIPAFIRRHGGQVPTKLLADHYNRFCVTAQDSDDFKTALNRVAEMKQRGGTMRGIWSLKEAKPSS
ncbi:putative DNA repair and recombination protein RAD26 [Pseudomassariella vexata]|uniref:Putative DNA repair and recombination protein RAD26 n=1 Tax=Pseudomassariella vexata TaxID=1141098 RepID=A0A1Y2E9Z1_9PEZI|nr:putative DNA repair and recombination protein RAD26 [Pseudomassariella vexata]ORY68393.1 putative DNA repair and recombination protein RAD26 [Pseudomassariella vexata]